MGVPHEISWIRLCQDVWQIALTNELRMVIILSVRPGWAAYPKHGVPAGGQEASSLLRTSKEAGMRLCRVEVRALPPLAACRCCTKLDHCQAKESLSKLAHNRVPSDCSLLMKRRSLQALLLRLAHDTILTYTTWALQAARKTNQRICGGKWRGRWQMVIFLMSEGILLAIIVRKRGEPCIILEQSPC